MCVTKKREREKKEKEKEKENEKMKEEMKKRMKEKRRKQTPPLKMELEFISEFRIGRALYEEPCVASL